MSNTLRNYEDVLFEGVYRENWQMMPWERIALAGLLGRLRPKVALEVGVYHGGSLSLTAQYAEKVIAIDIDPQVPSRFAVPSNVDLRIGDSSLMIDRALDDIRGLGQPLHFVLIDADHSRAGVCRDIACVLAYRPSEPMLIIIHDSANPDCRKGILSAPWDNNPHVHFVECDFVPGQLIEHTVKNGRGEMWGGLALAFCDGPSVSDPSLSARQREARSHVFISMHQYTDGR